MTDSEILRALLAVGGGLAALAILQLMGRSAIDRRVAWTLSHADRGPLLTWRLRRAKDGFIRTEESYAAFCAAGLAAWPAVGLLVLVELALRRPPEAILGETVVVHGLGLLLGLGLDRASSSVMTRSGPLADRRLLAPSSAPESPSPLPLSGERVADAPLVRVLLELGQPRPPDAQLSAQ